MFVNKAFLSNNWITTGPKLLHWRATVIEEFLLSCIFYYWVFCDALIQVHESVYLTSRVAKGVTGHVSISSIAV